MLLVETAICSRCNETLMIEDFSPRQMWRGGGHETVCIKCERQRLSAANKLRRAVKRANGKETFIRSKGECLISKICSYCKMDKLLECFYRKKRYPSNYYSGWSEHCKACNTAICKERRERLGKQVRARVNNKASQWRCRIKRDYGITEDIYYEMFNSQEGKCAICKTLRMSLSDLHIDHDKNTGIVRGLLCGHCNRAIGCLMDNIDNLNSAIKYLLRAKCQQES